MIKLYGMTGSGNCWKPAVLMKQLGQPFEWTEVNTLKGETRTPEFLALNANGRVPLLIVNGRKLAESNAMLCYLADGTDYFLADRWQRAKILEWMFFEQYSHEPYIATVRFWVHFMHKQDEWKEKIAEAMKKGHAALGVMEQQLLKTSFLAGARYSIADIALYAYTHVAHEGGYDLSAYPAIKDWMKRVEAQPKFEKMAG
ncbi:MAG: glutathione S-transferase family protein [Pseudomonadota bacterium]